MYINLQGMQYDTDECEVLGIRYNIHTKYGKGSSSLLRAHTGLLMVLTTVMKEITGNECRVMNTIEVYDPKASFKISDYSMTADQVIRCQQLDLL